MRGKPLLAGALALIFGLLFGEAFTYFPVSLSLLVFFFLFLDSRFFNGHYSSIPLLLIWGIGFALYHVSSNPPSPNNLHQYMNQGSVRIQAQIIEAPRYASNYVALQMQGLSVINGKTPNPVTGEFRLFIAQDEIPFGYGDQLEMTLRLREPRQYENPGTFLYADYQARIGVQGMAWLSNTDSIKKIGESGNPLIKRITQTRATLREKIKKNIHSPAAPLMLSMLIGESGYIDDEVRAVFTHAGLAHLLAVSGTHLAFVALLIFSGSRWLLLRLPESALLRLSIGKHPTQWAVIPTAIGVIFYTFLAGGKISTIRALIMILVYLFSIWVGRQRDLKVSLAFAALIIIIFDPRSVFEISFILSFTAVLSILLFIEWWQAANNTPVHLAETLPNPKPTWRERYFDKPVFLLLLTSLSASIGTAPLTLYFFHQFSWAGWISNLILTPLAGWFLIPFSLAFSVLSLLSESFLFSGGLEGLWSLFFYFVRFFSDLPGAGFHLAAPPLILVFLFYGTLFFMLGTHQPKKLFLITLFSFFVVFLGWGILRIPPDHVQVTFLDVGQGDAAFIEFPTGETVLVDGGRQRAGKFGVAPFLWQRRVRQIDLLITTHPQFDHIGGLPFILRNFKVKAVWSNGLKQQNKTYEAFLKAIDHTKATHYTLPAKSPGFVIPPCTFSFLHPSEQWNLTSENANNTSIVFSMTCADPERDPVSLLFTGDIEQHAERLILENRSHLKSTIIKVPHHGSRSSSTEPFVSAVSPKIALISSGRNNPYRHPHPETLARYKTHGATIYRTDQEGAITLKIGKTLSIKTYRNTRLLPIQWANLLFPQEWQNLKKTFTVF